MVINVFLLLHYLCREIVVDVFVLLNTLSDNSKQQILTTINNAAIIK